MRLFGVNSPASGNLSKLCTYVLVITKCATKSTSFRFMHGKRNTAVKFENSICDKIVFRSQYPFHEQNGCFIRERMSQRHKI